MQRLCTTRRTLHKRTTGGKDGWFKPSSARGVRGTDQCLIILRSAAPVPGWQWLHPSHARDWRTCRQIREFSSHLVRPAGLTAWACVSSFSERWEGSNVPENPISFYTTSLTWPRKMLEIVPVPRRCLCDTSRHTLGFPLFQSGTLCPLRAVRALTLM